MKSAGLILTFISGFGLFAMSVPNTLSQTPGRGESLLSASDVVTYQPTEEAMPVRSALNQFDNALALHDVDLLESAGVKRADAKRWQKFFKDNPHATVTDQCPDSDLLISDNTATWTCTETATILSEGKPRAFAHVIRFTFARNNGIWTVADRR